MRRYAFLLTAALFVAAACNALTGAGDLTVCEGAACAQTATTSEAGLSDVTSVSPGADVVTPSEAGGPDTATCAGCPEACVDGVCALHPSCRAGALKCGTTSASCCESKAVPGGTFERANDDNAPATISPFHLDTYEVTVGRFRAFVQSGGGIATNPPAAGAGAHPKIAGSGWQSSWNSQLANTTELLVNGLLDDQGSYTRDPGPNEQKPVTHLSWFEAFAFCAWDGGRLPTFAELNFAHAGGDEQRYYPWSDPPQSKAIDQLHASYECGHDAPPLTCPPPICVGATPAQTGTCNQASCVDAGGGCQDQPCFGCDPFKDLPNVGSLPAGAGRWGHLDLAGGASEMTLDAKSKGAPQMFSTPCTDCAKLMGAQPGQPGSGNDYEFLFAGGDFGDWPDRLATEATGLIEYNLRFGWLGFRCARDR